MNPKVIILTTFKHKTITKYRLCLTRKHKCRKIYVTRVSLCYIQALIYIYVYLLQQFYLPADVYAATISCLVRKPKCRKMYITRDALCLSIQVLFMYMFIYFNSYVLTRCCVYCCHYQQHKNGEVEVPIQCNFYKKSTSVQVTLLIQKQVLLSLFLPRDRRVQTTGQKFTTFGKKCQNC